jgi:ribosomal-protein-alanine N-acetyltransferase
MIRGKHIVLRTLREADIDPLFELMSAASGQHEFQPTRQPSIINLRQEFNKHGMVDPGKIWFLVWLEGRIIGAVKAFSAGYFDALELGYGLYDTSLYNRGYITEAVALLVDYLFKSEKINRLQMAVATTNHASRRVAQKSGFQSEGVLRGALYNHGRHYDLEMFSLLRAEFFARQGQLPD